MSKLFPEINDHTRYQIRRTYVRECLDDMAKDGELFLTECLNQPGDIPDLVREVIAGHDFSHDGQPRQGRDSGESTPHLKAWICKFKIIPHKVHEEKWLEDGRMLVVEKVKVAPISFKLPPKEIDSMTLAEARAAGNVGSVRKWDDAPRAVKNVVEIDDDKGLFELPILEAMYCLNQIGKDVSRARSRRTQLASWRCEEIHPTKPQGEPPKRKKIGRPRKSKGVSADVKA